MMSGGLGETVSGGESSFADVLAELDADNPFSEDYDQRAAAGGSGDPHLEGDSVASSLNGDDDIGGNGSVGLKFGPGVQQAIDELMPRDDPMYRDDFVLIDHINSLFPTEQSLTNIDTVISQVNQEIVDMDSEIAGIIHAQTAVSKSGQESLVAAKLAIQDLFTRIREIRQKTDTSEMMVREITRDIKQLDCAKKNLTTAISTLTHLQMLVGGVESLESLVRRKQYGEIANLLPGIMNVLEHFDRFMHIEQVKELSEKVGQIRAELGKQIVGEFKEITSGGKPFNATPHMADSCKLVSVLDAPVKEELITWYVELQLSEYKVLFDETEDNAWLDKIDQRFGWFKRFLIDFESRFNALFPPSWDMPQRLALDWCRFTARQLRTVMQKRKSEIDAKLLQFAINRTSEFEALMMARFPLKTVSSAPPAKGEGGAGGDQQKANPAPSSHPFQGIIRNCYEPFLSIFTIAQDESLHMLINKFVQSFLERGPPRPELEAGAVNLQSSSDLFVSYRKCILSAGQVSLGNRLLLDMIDVFKKYLRQYAARCLTAFLPNVSTAHSGLIQSLLKEGEIARLSKDDHFKICCILVTSEYCAETTKQLQNKLLEKLGDQHKDKVDMSGEQEVFYQVISNCVQLLVQDLEFACDPALSVMTKKQWASVTSVGDESSYVISIKKHIHDLVPRIRDYLITARKYFIQFATKFANNFLPKFINAITKCKPMSVSGAEQLLLDTHALKTELLNLPNVDSQAERKPPNNYTKLVLKGMAKAEMMLKLVMSSEETAEGFVSSFMRLLPEGTPHDFQQVLELRGLRRAEQANLIELYQRKMATTPSPGGSGGAPISIQTAPHSQESGSDSGPLSPSPMAPILASFLPPDAALAHDSRIKKLEKLIKKRL